MMVMAEMLFTFSGDYYVGSYLVNMGRSYSDDQPFNWLNNYEPVNPDIFPWRRDPRIAHKDFRCGKVFYGGDFIELEYTRCDRTAVEGVLCEVKGKIIAFFSQKNLCSYTVH